MSEPAPTGEELRALRLAAERGDVNGCWDASQKLLRQLPVRRALQEVCDFVTRRLPVFERHQPGVHWPRTFIKSICEKGSTAHGGTWPESEDDFPGPGANNFTRAVEALWKASRRVEDEHRLATLLADALAEAIGAQRLESWGARHPEAWARWYQLAKSGGNDVSRFEVLLAIKRDPEAIRIEKEAWLEVAQLMEEALNASTPEPR
jgi:hypothetical protein